jgi:protein-disulfide isomerase
MPRPGALALVFAAAFSTAAISLAAQSAPAPSPVGEFRAADDSLLIRRADESRTYFADSSRITLDEFIDFACSHCRDFHVQRSDSLRADLVATGEVNFRLRVFPIWRLLRGFQAGEAAFCAGGLGGKPAFEGMWSRLYAAQDVWRYMHDPQPLFESWSAELDLPAEEFRDCLARDAMAPLILSDIAAGARAGVRGTPTFVVNLPGEWTGDANFAGNVPMARFHEALETLRARSSTAAAAP